MTMTTTLIERLRSWRGHGLDGLLNEAADEIERLRADHAAAMTAMDAEIERLRADAERYRWLRDTPSGQYVIALFSREWDTAIDAARKETP